MQKDTQEKISMIDVTANQKKILGKSKKWVWIGFGSIFFVLILISMGVFLRSQWRIANSARENTDLASLTETVENLRNALSVERATREKSDAALQALKTENAKTVNADITAETLTELTTRLSALEEHASSKKVSTKKPPKKEGQKEKATQPAPVSISAPSLPSQPNEISSNTAIMYLYRLRVGLIEGHMDNNARDALSKISMPPAEWANITKIPTLFGLKQDFPAAARRALKACPADIRGDGWKARFFAFLRKYNGARSLSPQAGNSADAILSRTEAALHRNDISAAYRTLKDLPQAGRLAMENWIKAAKNYNDFWAGFAAYERTLLGGK